MPVVSHKLSLAVHDCNISKISHIAAIRAVHFLIVIIIRIRAVEIDDENQSVSIIWIIAYSELLSFREI